MSRRTGFPPGFTAVTRLDDERNETGIAFGVLKLRAGEIFEQRTLGESAFLLMHGAVQGTADELNFSFRRESLFDESASCVHVAAGTQVSLSAISDTELTIYACANTARFEPRAFQPEDVPNEYRGRGQVRDRSLRFVRTIFDRSNSSDNVELVLGEVVTLPGGWSSYPPHHHPQPEIYHYRFSAAQGYGHAELGEEVLKVRQFDTIRIPAGLDHAQCSAPGYGMYYAWVIRHLPDKPYTSPDFTAEHAWTMAPDASFWWPRES
jgi:5-deoxy-glucuronate isomerase